MGLFGMKKKKKQCSVADFDMKEIIDRVDVVNKKIFDDISRTQYITAQCEQIVESTKYIEETKKEYTSVVDDINDILAIEKAEKDSRQMVKDLAIELNALNNERVLSRNKRNRLPASKYDYYLAHEDELSDAVKKMQNDEQYYQMIKRDLNMLEGEKLSLMEDIDRSIRTQKTIKNILLAGFVAIVICIGVIIAFLLKVSDTGNYIGLIVLFMITLFMVFMVVVRHNSVYMHKLSEKKLNRAIVLQNKIKIKYINIVNSIEYQYAKYGVANSYEFASTYQDFLADKADREHYARTAGRLGKVSQHLSIYLRNLGVKNVDIWHNQLEALFNPKKMQEVTAALDMRRKKLKEQIELNMKHIDSAKQNIDNMLAENPDKAKDIKDVIDGFSL